MSLCADLTLRVSEWYSMELSNNIVKLVASLALKKHRDEHKLFVAEGSKCVLDTINYFNCKMLIARKEWIDVNSRALPGINVIEATGKQMERISQFKTPSDVVAVYEIPANNAKDISFSGKLTLALDGVQDPGNLGTIMRLADWFGITQVLCGEGTVDVYNHKVVQATMGAISRVKTYYCNLEEILPKAKVPIFVTALDGENIYNCKLPKEGIVVLGNEGNGVSKAVMQLATKRLLIPTMCNDATSESLNVSTAAAITISEFCRNALKTK